jgi:hypothetical protein
MFALRPEGDDGLPAVTNKKGGRARGGPTQSRRNRDFGNTVSLVAASVAGAEDGR